MRTPTSEHAKRIATMMHRRHSTPWDRKEVRKIRELETAGCFKSLDELSLVERRYRMNWPPRHNKNSLRTDLFTVINNWPTEIDRAVQWDEQNPIKVIPKKIIDFPPVEGNGHVESVDPEQLARFEEQRRIRKEVRQ